MKEIEYHFGDEQDEEKLDRELSEEELEAVAGGKASAEGMVAANAESNLASLVERDAERDADAAALKDADRSAE